MPDIIISSGGALVKYKTEYIYRAEFSEEETNVMIDMARNICGNDCEITIDTIDAHYWNYKIDPKKLDKSWGDSIYTDFSDFNECSLKMCVEIFNQDKADKLTRSLSDCDCIRFSDGFWYKFTKKNVTKENAIIKITEVCGFGTESIIAFGDDYADIGMLQLCGTGVAMGNAIDEVKERADIVIGSNDEEGIADFIENEILQICTWRGNMVEIRFYDTVNDELLKFAVIISQSNGKWVFCKHKERDTYEVPGGHRETGENILETAKRELQEETGAIKFEIKPICVYSVTGKTRVNDTGEETFGLLCFAEITEFAKELHSEMEKVVLMDELPENWTYPLIQPKLVEKYLRVKNNSIIGATVTVTVDRPLGSYHPEYKNMYYPINYGYIEGVMAPDGEEQDAYILGVNEPVGKFTGKIIAIVHRKDDVEEKWVVVPDGMMFSKDEIRQQIYFQEQYFDSEIVM